MHKHPSLRTRRLAPVAAAVFVGLAASAATVDAGPGRLFERLDQNGNGRITLDEVESAQQARRARIDGDGDGVLTRAEFVTVVGRAMAGRVERLEASDRPGAWRLREHIDSNGDGRLSGAEQSAWIGGLFDRLDSNGDGRLDETEARARAERVFARADVNGDGEIDRDEASRMKRRHGAPPIR